MCDPFVYRRKQLCTYTETATCEPVLTDHYYREVAALQRYINCNGLGYLGPGRLAVFERWLTNTVTILDMICSTISVMGVYTVCTLHKVCAGAVSIYNCLLKIPSYLAQW